MEQVQTHIEKLKQLSLKFDELNHPEKLETLKSVRGDLKISEIRNKKDFVCLFILLIVF